MSQRKRFSCMFMGLCALLLAMGAVQTASAKMINRTLCIYDPIGANGFIYQELQDYITAALRWGVHFQPHAYSNEGVAASDFKAGKCDAVEFTGIRNMHFVKFAGSLDMAGGLQTYKQEHTAIQVMSSPKAAKYMQQGPYETVGVIPAGKVFLFAHTKKALANLQQAAGKKIAVMSYDKQASALVNVVGASPVPSTIADFGPKFNNDSVDYAYAPSFAYKALELYKGLGKNGGIADFVLGMLSLQIDIHKKDFPQSFGQKSRTWVLNNLWQPALRRIKHDDNAIPNHYWVHISGPRAKKYRTIFLHTRQRLWNDGWYNHKMQHLLKQIRCNTNPSLAECSEHYEGGPVN